MGEKLWKLLGVKPGNPGEFLGANAFLMQFLRASLIFKEFHSGPEQSMKPMIGKSIDQSMTIDAN